jgi:hypothetical protein
MSNQEPVISLESYAAVIAGLGAGLSLPRALLHARVQPTEWDRAAELWQSRIDESAGADLVLLVAFDAALLAAKRRFEPTIEPIESDPQAWVHFRRHFVTAADPRAFLSQQGLSLATYARIEADWANRLLADEALAAAIQNQLATPLEECPALTLTPSPLLLPKGTEPPPEASVRPEPPEAVLSLDQYASLCAELSVFPWAAEEIFQRYGLEAREKRYMVDVVWKERLQHDRQQYEMWQRIYWNHHEYWTKRGTPAAPSALEPTEETP